MIPTPAEYQRGLSLLKDVREVPVDDLDYHERVAELKKRRLEEKSKIPDVARDPSKDYRWCNPRTERFPYLVMAGWVPVSNGGDLVCDNELILCSKDRTIDCGEAQVVGDKLLTMKEQE